MVTKQLLSADEQMNNYATRCRSLASLSVFRK